MDQVPSVVVEIADLSSRTEAAAMISLLDAYARDIKGAGEPLSNYTRDHLAEELQKRVGCCVFIARVNGTPAGLSICFESFSTFACRPVLNIHDFLVAPEFRGQGISKLILAVIQSEAVSRGCCKLTLEVLEHNTIAVNLYKKFGFQAYELDPQLGRALFYEKPIEGSE